MLGITEAETLEIEVHEVVVAEALEMVEANVHEIGEAEDDEIVDALETDLMDSLSRSAALVGDWEAIAVGIGEGLDTADRHGVPVSGWVLMATSRFNEVGQAPPPERFPCSRYPQSVRCDMVMVRIVCCTDGSDSELETADAVERRTMLSLG